MRNHLLILLTLVTGCGHFDRGACLETRRVPMRMIMAPRRIGNVTSLQPLFLSAHDECSRWQFPNGRQP